MVSDQKYTSAGDKIRTMRLVNNHNLILEVNPERFARTFLKEEVVGKGDELREGL